jgi:phage gpG-like protein
MSAVASGIGLSLSIDFDLTGMDSFFDRLEEGVQDITGNPLGQGFLEGAKSYDEGIFQRFGEYSQGGGDWAALSPKYAARKLKTLGHEYILVWSGHLFLSVRAGASDNILFLLPDGVVTGTDSRIAAFHQFGTSRMAARPFMVAPDDPGMPSTTLDNMTFDIERGFQRLIDYCAQGV